MIFSIAMGANYSFYVKSIATCAPTFFGYIISVLDSIHKPFLSALQNMGVEFLHGVENFHQGEVLFVQAAHNFLHAAKMHCMQL